MFAATRASAPMADSWTRSPNDDLRPAVRNRLLRTLQQEEDEGRLTGVVRILRAICFCGTSAPLALIAAVAGYSRKQAGRLWLEIEARGIGRSWEIKPDFARCTHVEDPGRRGHEGRHECEKLRREQGIEGGCAAHHGHAVRTLLEGLTPGGLLRGLRMPRAEVQARLRARAGREKAKREELRTPSNHHEAKAWGCAPKGRPAPKGEHVTPIPDLPLLEPETSASSGTVGETIDSSSACNASPAVAPSAPEVVATHNEPSPPPPAPTRLHESCGEGEGERIVPAKASARPARNVRSLRAGLLVARDRDWFCLEWRARNLGPLNRIDLSRIWCICRDELGREELAFALNGAARMARLEPRNIFGRVFTNAATMREIVHEERMRRVLEKPTTKQGGAPKRLDEMTSAIVGSPPSVPLSPPRPEVGKREPIRLAPVGPPITDEEAARRRAEQRAILQALIDEELVEIPIKGDVK